MAQTPHPPVELSSEYDTICYRHSAQVTADNNEFTKEESDSFHNLVDPIVSWKDQDRWLYGPFNSHQINKHKREGTPCTKLQELVFNWINTYAASRPTGAPPFVCHTRRSTGNEEPHKKGEKITAWEKQVVAASPPERRGCYPAQPADSAFKSLEGKCYEITVPENSTYLVVNEKTEILFPAGCTFEVLKDEKPGQDIKVKLLQYGVIKPGEPFWGHVDAYQSIDEWWNGTIELLRKPNANFLWKAANLELTDEQKTIVSLDTDVYDDLIDKEHVRSNIHGAAIAYSNPYKYFTDGNEYGDRATQLNSEIDLTLHIFNPVPERIAMRKNFWRATGGLDLMTAFQLRFEPREAKASFIDMCF